MMNVLQIQDNLKNFSEEQLIKEMQQPSGSAPQFLVLSELNRRKRVKGDLEARQAQQQPTVAEDVVASAGVPQSGMMGMSEAMAPASVDSGGIGSMMPKTMKMGGEVDSYAEGGLIEGIAENVNQNAETLQQLTQSQAETSKLLQDQRNTAIQQPQIPRPMPIQQPMPMPIQQIRPRIPGFGGKGGPTSPQMPGLRPFNIRTPMNRFGATPPQPRIGGIGQYASTFPAVAQPRFMAEGGVVRAANGLSLADKNLNPGNIRPAGFFGETGANKGYATYASPEFGLRSIAMLSDKYAKDYGIGTVNDFIEKYAPKSDDNVNNKAYAKMVADSLGVDPDEQVDFTDDNVKRAIIPAITKFEGYSQDIDPDMLNRAIAGSKETDDESKVNELLSGVDSFSGASLPATNTGVPKGVRPDFNINSVPRNMREKKYLEQLKREQLIGKQQKRPILSDILEKNVKEDQKKPKPSILEEKTKPLGFEPFPDPYSQNRKEQLGGMEGRYNQDVYSDGYGIFTDIDPLANIQSPTIKENIKEKLIKEDKLPSIKKIGGSDEAIQKEILQKLGPSKESLEAIDDESAIIGSDIPLVYDLQSQVTDTGIQKEKPPAPKIDTTATTSLEQELLKRQSQLQKDRDFDRYMALAQAGLSIMSSDKPTLAGAIGEGGTAGLTAFRDAQKRYQEGLTDILNARVKLANKKTGLTQKDAITAISSIDSDIAKYRTEIAKAIDPAEKKSIQDAIAHLEFQKERLLPIAGFSRLSMNVSDSASK